MDVKTVNNQKNEVGSEKPINRFLIPQQAAGVIVRKGGEKLNLIKEKHKCEISVPSSIGPERLLIIIADIDKLCDVLLDIFNITKLYMHSKVNDPKDIMWSRLPDNVVPDEMDLRCLFNEHVCQVINDNIAEMYVFTVVKVYHQMCPVSTERVIRIVGLPENILICLRAIHELIEVSKVTLMSKEYDPDNYNELHAVNYGGWMTLESRRQMIKNGGPPPVTFGPTPKGKSSKVILKGGKQRGDVFDKGFRPSMPLFSGVGRFEGDCTLGQMGERLRSQNIMVDLGLPPYRQGIMEGLTLGQMGEKIRAGNIVREMREEMVEPPYGHYNEMWF